VPNKPAKTAASRIAEVARSSLPPDIRKRSGRALYSPTSTLESGSPIYFLGIYPGFVEGNREPHNDWSIDFDLDRLAAGNIREHAYLDERWGEAEVGQDAMQKKALHVFTILARGPGDELLRKTPASNMILLRNKKENEKLLRSRRQIIELCWPFHQAIIDAKKPELVLVHGVGCAQALARILKLGEPCRQLSEHDGQRYLYAWELPQGRKLLAIPSLGRRYDPSGRREEALTRFFQKFAPNVIGA